MSSRKEVPHGQLRPAPNASIFTSSGTEQTSHRSDFFHLITAFSFTTEGSCADIKGESWISDAMIPNVCLCGCVCVLDLNVYI